MVAEKTNHSDYIVGFLELLADEKVSCIDFDELKARLTAIAAELGKTASMAEDLQVLRDDFTQRIGGMLKAIAAVYRKRHDSEQALELVEQLPALTTRDLLEAYRRVSARFRDAFPTSFGYTPGRSVSPRLSQADNYK
jgi:hypothetical protein